MSKELLFKDEVYAIVGAAMDVYNELGFGFAEPVYQEAMELELRGRPIPFEPQKRLSITYKGIVLKKRYFADFVCFGNIIVELKAQRELGSYEKAQVLNSSKQPAFDWQSLSISEIQTSSTGRGMSSSASRFIREDSCQFVQIRGSPVPNFGNIHGK